MHRDKKRGVYVHTRQRDSNSLNLNKRANFISDMQSMYINLTRTFPDLDFPKEEMYGCFSHKSREAGKRYPTECDRCYRFQPVFYFQQQFPTRCILCDLDQRVQDYCEYIAPRASRPHSQKELESEVLNKVWFEQFSPWKEAANRTLNTARQPLVSEREIRQSMLLPLLLAS